MTIDDCINKLIAKEKCMERETSGTDTDCNYNNCLDCSLCYEQGRIEEQKEALIFAIDTMHKYQQLQVEYETRLKADMIAMLTEIQLELEELRAKKHFQYKHGQEHGLNDALEIIQRNINALKSESETENESTRI